MALSLLSGHFSSKNNPPIVAPPSKMALQTEGEGLGLDLGYLQSLG